MTPRNAHFDLLMVAGLLFLAFMLLGPVLTIPLHIPINYNEGWNALLDTRAVTPGTGPLYPGADSFVFNNYPPLGFYLVGWLGRFVFGDMIVAGRVLSLLCLLAGAGLLGLCVRFLHGGLRAALAAGLLMLLYMSTYYHEYVAMDDPQWLAHATMLAALAVLLCGGGFDRLRAGGLPSANLVGAAVLMVAGGFIKHNLVALPLSVTIWLACINRRAAVLWVTTAAIGLAAGLGALALLHGQVAFDDIFAHRRTFRFHLFTHSFSRLAPMLPMALVEIALLRRLWLGNRAARAAILFVSLFGAIATLTGIVQRVGEGVYYNAHFETLIAVCLGFGLALSPAFADPIAWRRKAFGPAALTFVAALPLVGGWPWHLPRAWAEFHDRTALVEAWQPVIARIAAADGPAGCLFQSLCWWAGKPSRIDVFNLTQSVMAGGPLSGFQALVARQGLAIFEDDPASFTHLDAVRKLHHDPIMEAFVGHYDTVLHGPNGIVLLAPIKPGLAQPQTSP